MILEFLRRGSGSFQLPLSGSPDEVHRRSERERLSTPSLGITRRDWKKLLALLQASFNSLSRDHVNHNRGDHKTRTGDLSTPSLGITRMLRRPAVCKSL